MGVERHQSTPSLFFYIEYLVKFVLDICQRHKINQSRFSCHSMINSLESHEESDIKTAVTSSMAWRSIAT